MQMEPTRRNSVSAADDVGRQSTFVVFNNSKGTQRTTMAGCNGGPGRLSVDVLAKSSHRRRVNSDGGGRAGCSLDELNHVTSRMKRHSLEERSPAFILASTSSTKQVNSGHVGKSCDKQANIGTRPERPKSQQCRGHVNRSDAKCPAQRRHSNEDNAPQQGRYRQRRRSMYDTSGPPLQSADFRSAMSAAAQAGRRASDSKLSQSELVEFFRERSLTDCNRASRMRVMARLVLRSPPGFKRPSTAWTPSEADRRTAVPRRRQLEPLMDRERPLSGGAGNHAVSFDDAVEHGVRVSNESAGEACDSLDELNPKFDLQRPLEADSVWLPTGDSPPPTRPSPTASRSPAGIVDVVGGCKPRPLIGRRARELLQFI